MPNHSQQFSEPNLPTFSPLERVQPAQIDAGVTPAEAEACLLHVVPEARAWWTPLKAAFACPPSKTTKKKGKKKKKSAAKGKKTKGKKKKKK